MLVELIRTTTADGVQLHGVCYPPAATSGPHARLDAVVCLHGVGGNFYSSPLFDALAEQTETSPVRCGDPEAAKRMMAAIDQARKTEDTLGGTIEVIAENVPIGLGSHVHWDRKLDGRLARALMSIQAIKGVEIGLGFRMQGLPGSKIHDPFICQEGRVGRTSWSICPCQGHSTARPDYSAARDR